MNDPATIADGLRKKSDLPKSYEEIHKLALAKMKRRSGRAVLESREG